MSSSYLSKLYEFVCSLKRVNIFDNQRGWVTHSSTDELVQRGLAKNARHLPVQRQGIKEQQILWMLVQRKGYQRKSKPFGCSSKGGLTSKENTSKVACPRGMGRVVQNKVNPFERMSKGQERNVVTVWVLMNVDGEPNIEVNMVVEEYPSKEDGPFEEDQVNIKVDIDIKDDSSEKNDPSKESDEDDNAINIRFGDFTKELGEDNMLKIEVIACNDKKRYAIAKKRKIAFGSAFATYSKTQDATKDWLYYLDLTTI
ncbi:hypothetical protein CR513_21748, partial [Mucuna pruriens]